MIQREVMLSNKREYGSEMYFAAWNRTRKRTG
jgi:hypothetical protein